MGRASVEARFWAKVDRHGADECWPWLASLGKGYGLFTIAGKTRLAHRVAYELLVGPIPEGLTLDHLCRNRACVNPAHLEPVTSGVNTLRGEGPSALNAQKTHCPRGHPLVAGNLLEYKSDPSRKDWRSCLTCHREDEQRRERRYLSENQRGVLLTALSKGFVEQRGAGFNNVHRGLEQKGLTRRVKRPELGSVLTDEGWLVAAKLVHSQASDEGKASDG